MLVSVIIPSFNRFHTLKRAIASVKNQTYQNYELIVVDDGSNDESESLDDGTFLYLKLPENKGVSYARNFGAKKASGKYLAFLDSDDEWEIDKLKIQVECIKKTNIKLVHTEEIWIRNGVRVNQHKKHKKVGGEVFQKACELCFISPSSVLIEKEIFFELGGFREDFLVCEDYDLWLKYTSLYPCEFIDIPLVKKYGGHEDQLSTKYFAMDYYRVKSLDFVLAERKLNFLDRDFAKNLLLLKCERLIQGYLKHQNLENLEEISKIQNKFL